MKRMKQGAPDLHSTFGRMHCDDVALRNGFAIRDDVTILRVGFVFFSGALERIEQFPHSGWNGSIRKKFLTRFDSSELRAP
ncbi:hypothetical protein ACVDG8_022855 [Mesorhizobium sp. ORM8.1]